MGSNPVCHVSWFLPEYTFFPCVMWTLVANWVLARLAFPLGLCGLSCVWVPPQEFDNLPPIVMEWPAIQVLWLFAGVSSSMVPMPLVFSPCMNIKTQVPGLIVLMLSPWILPVLFHTHTRAHTHTHTPLVFRTLLSFSTWDSALLFYQVILCIEKWTCYISSNFSKCLY